MVKKSCEPAVVYFVLTIGIVIGIIASMMFMSL